MADDRGDKKGRIIRFRAPPPPALVFPSFTNQSPLTVHGTTEPQSRIDAFLNNSITPTVFTQDGAFALLLNLLPNQQNSLIAFTTAHSGLGLTSAAAEFTIIHDNISPQVLNLQPENGSFINTRQPVLSAVFSDNLSQVDPRSVRVLLDNEDITSQASISSAGFTLNVSATLTEGRHNFSVSISDRAGNPASASSDFTVDVTPPLVTNFTPADGSTVAIANPVISAQFSDNFGVNVASVKILLDGADVTSQATISATGFSITPTGSLTQGSHTVSVALSDFAGNAASAASAFNISQGPQIPPDPATVAPPINPTVATDLATATEFLYAGPNPIQSGVAPGTIEPKRAAVLRGKVLDRDGNALPGVKISILNHPEFGSTLSRNDGMFDMAVNGGTALTVRYENSGFLAAQRQMQVPWKDYALLPDVVLVSLDPQVTAIDLSSTASIQVAQGTPVVDADGSRQATLLFSQGTAASMTLPDGSTKPLTNLSVRATEYTVGPNGRDAMPAELPPTSGYTYAAELS